jgi:hypothetical protein
VRRVENLTTSTCQLSRNSGSLNLLEPLRACPDLYMDSFTFNLGLAGTSKRNNTRINKWILILVVIEKNDWLIEF